MPASAEPRCGRPVRSDGALARAKNELGNTIARLQQGFVPYPSISDEPKLNEEVQACDTTLPQGPAGVSDITVSDTVDCGRLTGVRRVRLPCAARPQTHCDNERSESPHG